MDSLNKALEIQKEFSELYEKREVLAVSESYIQLKHDYFTRSINYIEDIEIKIYKGNFHVHGTYKGARVMTVYDGPEFAELEKAMEGRTNACS